MKKHAGYILLYVLGILVFLSVVGLGIAHTLRINAQIVLNEKERLQDDLALESALQYSMAQIVRAQLMEPELAAMDPSAAAKVPLWRPGGPYRVVLPEGEVLVWIEENSLPDLNLLSKEELQRILHAMGEKEGEAVLLAERMLQAGKALGKLRGEGGFADMREILALTFLPLNLRQGGGEDENGQQQSGLAQWVTVGTGVKTVDLNHAPLPVIGALTGASAASLGRFGEARRAKALSMSEAVQILGEPARQILQDKPSPVRRILLALERNGQVRRAEALVKDGKDVPEVLSYGPLQTGFD